MPRLFIGVPLPPIPGLDEVQAGLRAGIRGCRVVDLDQSHVTLKFLGSVPEHRVAPIDAAVTDALRPFTAHDGAVARVGAFPSERKARVVWAGIDDTRLSPMAHAIDHACAGIGFAREKRGFKPHITLARLREPADVMAVIEPWRETTFAPVRVDQVVLFESVLAPEGATYSSRAVWPLGTEVADPVA